MDPDANWTEQLELIAKMKKGNVQKEDSDRLAELKEALREWVSKGGFRPKAWGNPLE